MTIGKSGQTPNKSLTGVLGVPAIRKFRRRGDPKTMLHHHRHTWISDCHVFISSKSWCPPKQKSNIANRASSGSVSIDITCTSHRVCQQSSRDVVQMTYVDDGWVLFGCECTDVHDFLLPTSTLLGASGSWRKGVSTSETLNKMSKKHQKPSKPLNTWLSGNLCYFS